MLFLNELLSATVHAGMTNSLKDSYDRTIDYLRISITDKCNLKCIYCMPSQGLKHFTADEIMTNAEIVRFVRIAHKHGLRKVRITGGEPLLRGNITGLISSIKEIGIRDLSLTTNGIMLAETAGDLKRSGLDRVNISLDTMKAGRYSRITNGGDVDRVWRSIREAEKTGLSPVKINVVPIRGLNDDEIADFARLTFENNYHVRFIEFMPAVGGGSWKQDKYISAAEVMDVISRSGTLDRLEFRGKGPSRNYRLRGAAGVIGIISPLSDHFCGHCNRLRLTSDGKIRPCLFSKDEIDIRTPMRAGASDEEIDRLFLHAVRVKPERHRLNDHPSAPSPIDTMSRIGG